MAESDYAQRVLIVELRKRGLSPTEILQQYRIAKSQTKKWWGRWCRGVGLDDLPRGGRPEKLSRRGKAKLRALLKRKKGGSTRKVAADFFSNTGVRISKSTVSRVASQLGLRYRIRPKKPRLRLPNRLARLAFAQEPRTPRFWRRVVSTDEKTFTLQFGSRGQWVQFDDDPDARGTVKYDVGVRVWGGVCSRGTTSLFRIPKSMTGEAYRQFLETMVYPDLREKFGGNFVFQQDGDGSHTAAVVRAWLDEQEEEWIRDWPAQSPDMSPIENLWAIVTRRLEGRNVRTADGLWRALKEEWENIPIEICRNLGNSFSTRMEFVIDAEGGNIKY